METPEIEQVVEIHSNAKYVLVLPKNTTMAEAEHLKHVLDKWRTSGEQFLLVRGVTLQRIDE